MWVVCHVIKQEEKKQKLTTWHVGCTPCHQMRGKKTKIDNTACGLHTVLSNEREKNKN